MSTDGKPTDIWTDRINAFWNGSTKLFEIVLKICQILGPILAGLILLYQSQNKKEIKDDIHSAKIEVKAATDAAAGHAKAAAIESRANLEQWRAYDTKDPVDQARAKAALEHAERKNIIPDPSL